MHTHIIQATYRGPTNTRGSRVVLTSCRFDGDKFSEGYSYDIGNTYDQAREILTALGYTIVASGEGKDCFVFAVKEFRPLREAAARGRCARPLREAAAAFKAAKGGAK